MSTFLFKSQPASGSGSVYSLTTQTSNTKTPTGSGNFHQMTNNSMTLAAGTWRLFGTCDFKNGGSSPDYSQVNIGWFSANGADSVTAPSSITNVTGLTVNSAFGTAESWTQISGFSAASNQRNTVVASIIITLTQSGTIYLVPGSSQTTSSNARVTCYANAERLA